MIQRRAGQAVMQALRRQAAVALLGARQVGKTTLALEIAGGRASEYLDLGSRTDRQKLSDPALFLGQLEDRLVVLDEIHRTPEVFRDLRGLIDAGRRQGRRTGRFLILGSASMALLKQYSESLAGRIEYVSLNPFDVLEVAPDESSLGSLWTRGGFPESFLSESDDDSASFRRNLVRTYLERDIPQMGGRVSSETLENLWIMFVPQPGGFVECREAGGRPFRQRPDCHELRQPAGRIVFGRAGCGPTLSMSRSVWSSLQRSISGTAGWFIPC